MLEARHPVTTGSPTTVRTELGDRGHWSGETEVLDAALAALSGQGLAAEVAVVWRSDGPSAGRVPEALVAGTGGIVHAVMAARGVHLTWVVPAAGGSSGLST